MGIVYHGSKVGNLKKLSPNASMHGKSYLYATKHKQIALAYLGKFDSLTISQINHSRDGVLTGVSMVERKPNILKETYDKITGYLYVLSDEKFKKNQTEWNLEVVSDDEVDVIECIKIENVLSELKKTDNLKLYLYPERPEYIPLDDSDMIDKAIESYEITKNINIVNRYFEFYPTLKEQIKKKIYEKFNIDID